MSFERGDLFNKARKTVVNLKQDTCEAGVSHVLDADRAIFFPDSLLDWRGFRLIGEWSNGFRFRQISQVFFVRNWWNWWLVVTV